MEFDCNKDIYRTHPQTNVSAVAQNRSNITAPFFNNCTITGNVPITHNASGISGYHPDSDKTPPSANSVIGQYKQRICSEYQHVTEYNSLPGENVLLCERYTEPLIIQRHRDQKEREEEISSKGENFQQVFSSRSSHESVLNSLFHTDDHGITPRAVILQGNSGNGKSFVVQKIMMDWASGNLYKDQFDVVFHLKCKEINCIPGKKSLLELLSWSCGLTSDEISQMLQWSSERVLFIIDGFDELRLPQDVYYMTSPTDPDQRCTPVLTLCALLRGHLQVNSFLLVTSRSTATDTLSKLLKKTQRFTEIMGFSERGVEEYFQKFFQDEKLFRNAYMFVKDNETLLTACSIPVICWIICTVIRERFNDGADITSGLETTTSIYVDFVFTLLKHHSQGLNQSVPNLLRCLGQLAERGMQEQQVLFDEKIINETVQDPACCPFLCKFLFKRRIQQETMFSFMHLSFQEFFTALYYVCLDKDQAMMNLTKLCTIRHTLRESFYQPPRFSDVVKFAFGLLNKDLQCTLIKHGLFVHQNVEADLKQWFINKICNRPCFLDPFVFNYLYELHEKSFAEEAMQTWNKIHIRSTILRRTDCWALMYCAQCCHSVRSLNLGSYCELTPDKLSIILPVVHKFERLSLKVGNLTDSDLVDLMCAVTGGKTQRVNVIPECDGPADEHCSVYSLELSVSDDVSSVCLGFCYSNVVRSLGLTLPRSEAIDWAKLFQIFHKTDLDAFTSAIHSLPKLKMLELKVDFLNKSLSIWSLSICQNVSSLTELRINADFLLEEAIEILQRSHTRPNCTLTIEGLRCNKPSQKCTRPKWFGPQLSFNQLSCNQQVVISVNCQGFTERTLRRMDFSLIFGTKSTV
ncbi:NACHT, LRR and PYD domains-containing protein 1 homolog isoform X2 [Misgurnus anguillicaudatus]|uniref:NACHT, LRR and PYD domains-containing protein 1 homolog isoform X2 n=1 Tax=Misgurnus anguillicaudatus TaxID=75329 RepID=UPI003CCF1301